MDRLEVDAKEQLALRGLLDDIEDDFENLESDDSLNGLTVLAHELPRRIRDALNEFRRGQMSGLLCISGHVVDQDRIGQTPAHWRDRPSPSTSRREEILLLLFGSLLGDPFSWATQQDGRLIHDILPIKGHEDEQLASSSNSVLTWHTEDAFHHLRGDFVGFSCLRNPYAAATTIGYVDSLNLPEPIKKVLFDNRFSQLPDESHLAKNNSTEDGVDLFAGIVEMRKKPAPVAILFGNPDRPYIRADPYFISVGLDDHEAQHALDWLVNEMNEKTFDLRLESGDFCFLDNFRVVHGRRPFIARYDGTDRWLKRVNITCDLRKAQAALQPGSDRAIS